MVDVRDTVRDLGAGAGAGAVATAAMSALMLGAQRLGLMGEQPPETIVRKGLDRAGVPRSESEQNAAASALHLLLGVGLGVLHRLLRRRAVPLASRGGGLLGGMAFGLAVWAANYAGIAPALRILPPPPRDRPERQPALVAEHLVFGAVLGLLDGRRQARGAARTAV